MSRGICGSRPTSRRKILNLVIGLGVVGAMAVPVAAAQQDETQLTAAIKERLSDSTMRPTPNDPLEPGSSRTVSEGFAGPIQNVDLLRRWYGARAYGGLWHGSGGLRLDRVADLVVAIEEAIRRDGLPAGRYRLDSLESILTASPEGDDPEQTASVDLFLSDQVATLAMDLLEGVTRGEGDSESDPDGHGFDPTPRPFLEGWDRLPLSEVFDRARPRHFNYGRLSAALVAVRTLIATGETLRVGRELERGDTGAAVDALTRRLAQAGDLPIQRAPHAAIRYDELTEAAVRRFQTRNGLEANGAVDLQTLHELDRSPEERYRRILVNLERIRRTPPLRAASRIVANIPAFSLTLTRRGKPAWQSRVVVGRVDRQTPAFSAEMSHLVLAPDWTVPSSIAVEDKLPQIREDPNWFAAHQMELLERETMLGVEPATVDWSTIARNEFATRFVLRQRPGPQNALGRVKFIFPNRHSVYIHDTPNRELFSREVRAFSSGCVRVDRPLELARLLLAEEPGWTERRIEHVSTGDTPRSVEFTRPVHVALTYLTAWVSAEGALNFRDDVYDRDEADYGLLAKHGGLEVLSTKNEPPTKVANAKEGRHESAQSECAGIGHDWSPAPPQP